MSQWVPAMVTSQTLIELQIEVVEPSSFTQINSEFSKFANCFRQEENMSKNFPALTWDSRAWKKLEYDVKESQQACAYRWTRAKTTILLGHTLLSVDPSLVCDNNRKLFPLLLLWILSEVWLWISCPGWLRWKAVTLNWSRGQGHFSAPWKSRFRSGCPESSNSC